MKEKVSEMKKKAAQKAVALSAAASLLAGGLFAPPAAPAPDIDPFSETEIVETLLPDPEMEMPAIEAEPEEEKKKRQRAPLAMRLLCILGLWIAGAVLISAVTSLLSVLPALLAGVLGWAAGAAVTLLLAGAAAKLLFPEKKLKEILSRKNLPWLLGGAAVIGILSAAAEAYLAENPWVKTAAIAAGTAILFGFAVGVTTKHRREEKLIGGFPKHG